ncbi:hypothetical protein GGF32_001226 [Allomyces javanicus]|nr:hypothetical protein GGF32_001226 [Allomyces javanicus]
MVLFLVITAAVVRAVPTMFTIGVILQYTYSDNTPYPDTDDVFAMTSLALPAMNALDPAVAQFQFVKGDSQGTRAGAIAAMLNISSTYPNPVAFIGEWDSATTIPLVLAEGMVRAWHCSGVASSTDLSDKQNFARFFRTIQDDSQQGPALIQFVKTMGWGSVNLVTATDAYGTSIAASTIAAAPGAGITISTQSVVSPVATDFTSVIATLRKSLSNIIIFAMPTAVARELLQQARAAGLVAREYVWISTDIFSDYLSTSAALPTAAEDIANADGAFYVYPRAATETAAYAALLAAWARVSSRAVLNVPYGTLCYDCAVALARGIVQTVQRRGVAALTSAAGNLTLAEFMPPAYEGVSGTVQFTSTGDRVGDFSVWNTVNGNLHLAYDLFANGTRAQRSTPMFAGGSTVIPPDTPPKSKLYPTWSDPVVIVLAVLRALMLGVCMAGIAVLSKNRHVPLVKNMSYPFLVVISVGVMVVLVAEFMVVGEPAQEMCHAPVWVLTVGYQLVVGSTGVRTYRIFKIFSNTTMARMKQYSNAKLLRAVAALIAVQSALYAVRATVFASTAELVTSKSTVSYQCVPRAAVGDRVIVGVSLALNVALLAAVIVLGYKTRNVASAFRETLWIMYTGQNVAIAGIVILTFTFIALPDFSLAAYYLRSFLTLYASTFAYMALVGRVALAALHSPTASTLAMVPSAVSATTSATTSSPSSGGTTSSAHVHVDFTATGQIARATVRSAPVKQVAGAGWWWKGWTATWHVHAVHIVVPPAGGGNAYLALVPAAANGVQGTAFAIAGVSFDPRPADLPLCVVVTTRNGAWAVQLPTLPDADAAAGALAAAGARSVGGGGGAGGPGSSVGSRGVRAMSASSAMGSMVAPLARARSASHSAAPGAGGDKGGKGMGMGMGMVVEPVVRATARVASPVSLGRSRE